MAFTSTFFPLVANSYTGGNRIEELAVNSALDLTGSGIVGLNVSNIQITGGTAGQVLQTDGTGVLSWATGGGAGVTQPAIEFTVPVNANNQTFTHPNIATFLGNSYAAVYINGVLQSAGDYEISGTTLTVNIPLNTTDEITVGPTSAGGGTSSAGTVTSVDTSTAALNDTGASSLGFSLTGGPITSSGIVTLNVPSVSEFRTNASIGNVANLNLNGDSSTFLNGAGVWTVTPITAAGADTQVQFNSGGSLAGSANLTFNGSTLSAVNINERVEAVTGTVINLANAAYFTKTLTGPTTLTVTGAPSAPGVGSFILHVGNAVAGLTFSFGSDIKWAGGIAPTLTSSVAAVDVLGFYSLDGGVNWFGYVLGKDIA